jgi:hypothetical protein
MLRARRTIRSIGRSAFVARSALVSPSASSLMVAIECGAKPTSSSTSEDSSAPESP